ncbi:MAG TPA: hypothetical protein VII48_09105, partial [Rhizomicrobium sp.]
LCPVPGGMVDCGNIGRFGQGIARPCEICGIKFLAGGDALQHRLALARDFAVTFGGAAGLGGCLSMSSDGGGVRGAGRFQLRGGRYCFDGHWFSFLWVNG